MSPETSAGESNFLFVLAIVDFAVVIKVDLEFNEEFRKLGLDLSIEDYRLVDLVLLWRWSGVLELCDNCLESDNSEVIFVRRGR